MQFDSMMEIFDSTEFTRAHPVSPEGVLFTYYPMNEPESLHYHDFLEIGYCEHGSGLFYVDGDVIPFSGECCSIIYSGQIHIAQSVDAEKSLWHFLYIDLEKLFSGADVLFVDQLKAFSPHLYDFPVLFPREKDEMLYRLCAMIMEEAAGAGPDFLTVLRGLVIAMLTRHSRYMTPARHVRRDQKQLLDRLSGVLSYISQHYAEELTVSQLVNVSDSSKSTLQRDMIAFTGMAPLQYIHKLRMKRAVAMLSGEENSISQIAFSLGYASLSSFNRHFRAEYGVSPSEWLKTRQEKTLCGGT